MPNSAGQHGVQHDRGRHCRRPPASTVIHRGRLDRARRQEADGEGGQRRRRGPTARAASCSTRSKAKPMTAPMIAPRSGPTARPPADGEQQHDVGATCRTGRMSATTPVWMASARNDDERHPDPRGLCDDGARAPHGPQARRCVTRPGGSAHDGHELQVARGRRPAPPARRAAASPACASPRRPGRPGCRPGTGSPGCRWSRPGSPSLTVDVEVDEGDGGEPAVDPRPRGGPARRSPAHRRRRRRRRRRRHRRSAARWWRPPRRSAPSAAGAAAGRSRAARRRGGGSVVGTRRRRHLHAGVELGIGDQPHDRAVRRHPADAPDQAGRRDHRHADAGCPCCAPWLISTVCWKFDGGSPMTSAVTVGMSERTGRSLNARSSS